jgi:hypothetical protein
MGALSYLRGAPATHVATGRLGGLRAVLLAGVRAWRPPCLALADWSGRRQQFESRARGALRHIGSPTLTSMKGRDCSCIWQPMTSRFRSQALECGWQGPLVKATH